MKLYHGTYSERLNEIVESKILDNQKTDSSTKEYDDLLEFYLGKDITSNALYLTDDILCTQLSYDYTFTIDTSIDSINLDKLFVADFLKREDIMCAETEDESIKIANEYKNSLIPFKLYLENMSEYNRKHPQREFLYFDAINIASHIERKKEDILRLVEEFKLDYI